MMKAAADDFRGEEREEASPPPTFSDIIFSLDFRSISRFAPSRLSSMNRHRAHQPRNAGLIKIRREIGALARDSRETSASRRL